MHREPFVASPLVPARWLAWAFAALLVVGGSPSGDARAQGWSVVTRPQPPSMTSLATQPWPAQPEPIATPPLAVAPPCAACGERILPGVACDEQGCQHGKRSWEPWRPLRFQVYGQGEYIGPARDVHVPEYRLRVDDQLEFVYRLTRVESARPYELNVGDKIRVESLTDPSIDRELLLQPDGTITLRLLGQVRAARRTVDELRGDLEERYKQFYRVPAITVTPLEVNTRLEDLRASVDGRAGVGGGQNRQARVAPDGSVQLPAIGSAPAHGLTLDELKREVDARYAAVVEGIEVTPVLVARAPRHMFVGGEVRQPGRFLLEEPVTVMKAIAQAGGWNNGANLRQVVVFRRDEHWRLMATKLDLRAASYGRGACPDDIWVRDSDLILVPKNALLVADEAIELVFTRGLYAVFPFSASYAWGAMF